MCKSSHSSLALVLFALKRFFFHSREKWLFYCGFGFYFLLWLHSILITPLIAVTENLARKNIKEGKVHLILKFKGRCFLEGISPWLILRKQWHCLTTGSIELWMLMFISLCSVHSVWEPSAWMGPFTLGWIFSFQLTSHRKILHRHAQLCVSKVSLDSGKLTI